GRVDRIGIPAARAGADRHRPADRKGRLMHERLSRMIDAFRPADGPPPATLLAFFRWCLRGAWPGLGVAGVTSALSGAAEVASAMLLGAVVDLAAGTADGRTLGDNWPLITLFVLFFVVIRP